MGNVVSVIILLDSRLLFEGESIVPLFFVREIDCVLSFLKFLESKSVN